MIKKELHKKVLDLLAILLLLIVIVNMCIHLATWSDGWTEVFWFCNSAAILLSLGILLRKTVLVSTVLVTSIPAQFLWIVDFLLISLGFHGLGRTAELFQYAWPIILISIILHILIIPTAVYATWFYGFKKKSILISILFILYLFIAPYFLSTPDDNINCVFYPCDQTLDTIGSSHFPILYVTWQYMIFVTIRGIVTFLIAYFIFLFLFHKLFKNIKIH
jgi:hypothetical protein